METRHL